MRCNNCGWTNPEGLSKCQKCNQTLSVCEPLESKEIVTVEENNESVDRCLKCGYPLGEGADYCPNCGSLKLEKPKTGTVDSVNVQNRKTEVLDYDTLSEKEKVYAANSNILHSPNMEGENAVVGQGVKQPVNNTINKTVVDIPQVHTAKQDTRKTVVDGADLTSSKVVSLEKQEEGNASFRYKLSCVDGDSSMHVALLSSSRLALKKNEIVLIGGLRYRVDNNITRNT